eukprot:318874_1
MRQMCDDESPYNIHHLLSSIQLQWLQFVTLSGLVIIISMTLLYLGVTDPLSPEPFSASPPELLFESDSRMGETDTFETRHDDRTKQKSRKLGNKIFRYNAVRQRIRDKRGR